MDAILTADMKLKLMDGLDVKLGMTVPVKAASVDELQTAVREHVALQADSLLDALKEQINGAVQAAGSLWASR